MTPSATIEPDPAPITACTISREVQNFDLLIEDMEAALGEGWGDLRFCEALQFFTQPEAGALEFIALAMDESDEENLVQLGEIISTARAQGIKTILIAEDVSPAALHQLLRQGADEFVPYPLPEGELMAAITRLRTPPVAPAAAAPAAGKSSRDRNGVILAVHGLAGGTGASTFAVNLGYELASAAAPDRPRVCLLDLDLQFGALSTYLDLTRHDAVMEILSATDAMDDESFFQALQVYDERMHVFTAPGEVVPLDLVSSDDVGRVLSMARRHFDYVIVDMPATLVQWSETVLSAAQIYFVTMELDMRSAQNALRFNQALQAEQLPVEKLRYVLNRTPKFTDLNGRSRLKRLAESLSISFEVQLPDGGRPVAQAGDNGTPLGKVAAKNPLRREIARLAKDLHDIGQTGHQTA